ncbi:hypothetical protein KGF56_004311 [Candida oxycetoniae]|uniref:SPT2 chromatin protein n=1 Tax=Candida oxycetoniae TaxID=497107 RepID=A0AAI9STZ3_9ASCO|nr:uncharacterized protein KGF56_004311 [Candida oxycetoniae]KAI3402850.2 hypothetical protein KGF56_004311 [Candida oxycetoniae]
MGLSSILQQIDRKGKVASKPPVQTSDAVKQQEDAKVYSFSKRSSSIDRPVDPVIARLKEIRRLERERSEQGKPKKQDGKPRRPREGKSNLKRVQAPSSNASTPAPPAPRQQQQQQQQQQPARPKMTFSALMKKAAEIDQNKFSLRYPQKSNTADATSKPKKPLPNSTPKIPERANHVKSGSKMDKVTGTKEISPPVSKRKNATKSGEVVTKAKPKGSTPTMLRQANAKIQEMLKKKKENTSKSSTRNRYGEYDDEEEDLSDFVASDEDEVEENYNRDEIWAMFNKGKKRQYNDAFIDDDVSDMEATGAEVFEEERRSKINAEREDRLEQERLEKLAAMKRKKLKQ